MWVVVWCVNGSDIGNLTMWVVVLWCGSGVLLVVIMVTSQCGLWCGGEIVVC